jgi:hypothetical protein
MRILRIRALNSLVESLPHLHRGLRRVTRFITKLERSYVMKARRSQKAAGFRINGSNKLDEQALGRRRGVNVPRPAMRVAPGRIIESRYLKL